MALVIGPLLGILGRIALEKLPNLVGQTFIDYNDIANVPQITFTIGNKSFPLSPEQI